MKYHLNIYLVFLGLCLLYSCATETPPLSRAGDGTYDYVFQFNSDGKGQYKVSVNDIGYAQTLPLSWEYVSFDKYYEIHLSEGISLGGKRASTIYIRDNIVYFDYVDMKQNRTWSGFRIP